MKTPNSNQDRPRTRKRWAIAGAAMSAALLLAGGAYAHHRGGPGFGPGMGFHHLLRTLDLTEEQEVLAVRLMRQVREERQALKTSREANKALIQAQIASEKPDAEALHAVLDDMAAEHTRIAHAAIDAFLELHATLSAEQRAELVTAMEKMEARRRRWHED